MPWGKASNELVRAVYDQNVIAIIALDRASSHLAEQIGVKAFVPVIAVSSDHALTSTNIPWIFRMPEGTTLAAGAADAVGGESDVGPEPRQAARRAGLWEANRGNAVSDRPENRASPTYQARLHDGPRDSLR